MGGVVISILSLCMMSFDRKFKLLIVSALLICVCLSMHAQEMSDTLNIYFRIEKAQFDPYYKDNGGRCEAFLQRLSKLQATKGLNVVKLEVIGTASPEGNTIFNQLLSEARQKSVYRYLKNHINVPASIIVCKSVHEDWETLAREVEKDPYISEKSRVLDIIRYGEGNRLEELKKVDYGRLYRYIYHEIFPRIRACRVTFNMDMSGLVDEPVIEEPEEVRIPDDMFADLQVDTSLNITIQEPVPTASLRVKMNAAAYLMGQFNAAVEYDIIPHLSVTLPVYYSGGFDYFKETIKFRGVVVQPEVRYWPWLKDGKNAGFYVGAHLGVGWYNFAVDGEWRIQDHNGNRPSWGGGLGLGYALQFKKNPAWGMEFAVGGGVYDSLYDVFYNEPNGPYHRRAVHKVWWGVDNVSLSFTYRFDLGKKGGKR